MRVAIEGLPGSGKTSLSDNLAAQLGYKKIDEMIEVISETNDEECYVIHDLRKHRLFRRHKDVIMDRTYLSTLAFNYASDKVTGSFNFPRIAKKIEHCLQSGDLFMPDLLIFLDIPPTLSITRQKKGNASFWYDKNMLSYTEFFNKQYLASSTTSHILFVDAAQPFDVVCDIVHKTIANYNYQESTT